MKYRKKPVVIEAVQYDGHNYDEIVSWIDAATGRTTPASSPAGTFALLIETLEGTMRADAGDWIIRGVQGEFYPCKPDIFEATYEAVES